MAKKFLTGTKVLKIRVSTKIASHVLRMHPLATHIYIQPASCDITSGFKVSLYFFSRFFERGYQFLKSCGLGKKKINNVQIKIKQISFWIKLFCENIKTRKKSYDRFVK